MKIRIKDNSLRLRLTQGEVDQFSSKRLVSCTINFPAGNHLKYSLVWGNGSVFTATYVNNEICVTVPDHIGKGWLDPTKVGMEEYVQLNDNEKLRLLIEKDFACLSERQDEDESDMFPNPNDNC